MTFASLTINFDSPEEHDQFISVMKMDGIEIMFDSDHKDCAEIDVSGFTPDDFAAFLNGPQLIVEKN